MAFRPEPKHWWQRLARDFARWAIDAEHDQGLRQGVTSVELIEIKPISYEPAKSTIAAAPDFTFAAEGFAAAVAASFAVQDHTIRAVSMPEELPVDDDIHEQLLSVTEPYILWDSPKPPHYFATDYFFDGVEVLHSWTMPRPERLSHRLRFSTMDERKTVFRDLRKRRDLFRLSPDLVRSRVTRQ